MAVKKKIVQKENFFDRATRFVNQFEDSFVNFISVIIPWGVPLIPAVILFDHLIKIGWRPWVAFIAAAVVEGLGLATINTYFRFERHNKRYKDQKNKMPVWVVIVAYAWYLAIVLFVNVVFDIVAGVSWERIIAITAFSTLSLPASALISVRGMFSEWKGEHERRHSGTRTEANETNEPESKETNETNEQANGSRTFKSLTNEEKKEIKFGDTKALAAKFNVTERAIQKWKERIPASPNGVS
jgi:hypothetical protein